MRIIIIRHADPDYAMDSLTNQGWKEANLLTERLTDMDIKEFYLSPYGRAQDTAAGILQKFNRTGITLEWLREFWPRIRRLDKEGKGCCWDWLPTDWTKEPKYYNVETWTDTEIMKEGNVQDAYEAVCRGLDDVLAKHGYVREDNYYRVERANTDTIVFVCHFGLECVLLSYLLHVSPMILWQGFCAAPSSVTTVYTEERRKGIASFRISAFGDTSHLYKGGEEPSFSARFCECYDQLDVRHD